MSYRIRLGKISKTEKKKYENKTYEEVLTILKIDELYVYKLPNYTEIYELGKDISFEEYSLPFFDFELDEDEFKILPKEGLKSIIDDYHENICKHFSTLKETIQKGDIIKDSKEWIDILIYFNRKQHEWVKNKLDVNPYYLDENKTDGAIVRSWLYEYAIFNLVHIYRNFDYENDYLIYCGW